MANGAPDATEVVLVEFQTDVTQLESAQQILERTGQIDKKAADQLKKTNAELQKREQAVKNVAKATQQTTQQTGASIEEVNAAMQTFIEEFVAGWQEGIIDSLKEAGLELDEFGKIVNKNNEKTEKGTNSLKKELKSLTQQLAEMKLRGEDNTEEFRVLSNRAGELKDTIADVNAEVSRLGSDTRQIDGLIDLAGGIAGGFALAQGAIGLFGAESEQLQEVLLKVNSAMAILQGLQQIQNVLQKESAASVLANTAAQKLYTLAVGESIGALRLFRIALAATGIGAVLVAFGFLIEYLMRSSKATRQLTADFVRFNLEIERDTNALNEAVAEGTRTLQENQAAAKLRGEQQSKLTKQELQDLQTTQDAVFDLERAQRERAATAEQVLVEMANGERDFNEKLADEAQKTIDTYKSTVQRRRDLASEIRIKLLENEKQIQLEQLQAAADGIEARHNLVRQNSRADFQLQRELARARNAIDVLEAGKNAERQKLLATNLQKELADIDLAENKKRHEDRIAETEAALLKEQRASQQINSRTSQTEIDLQKKLIQQKSALDLLQEGLTEKEKTRIREQSLNDQLALQREFNKQSNAEVLQDFISANNAQLAQVNLSNEERQRLTEENIIAQAQIELDANIGLNDKIKEINARRDADIKAVRLQNIQDTVNRELELETARTGVLRRANERIIGDERKTLSARIRAVNQLASLDLDAINRKQDALQKQLRQGLISQEEYNLQYEKLKDEEARITEETELKKRELYRQTREQQIQFTIDTVTQLIGIIQQFGQNQTDTEIARIDEQRKRIDDLKEAGAITEKEATLRNKRLDNEERNIKRKQAERDKAIAIFQAIINTAAAVTRALASGGPVLAVIVAALGAAQIAAIANKPIPKFGTGKKGNYEGLAEVGETGAELIEQDGQMYIAPKRTTIWLGKKDKVFNPTETKQILEKRRMPEFSLQSSEINNVTQMNSAIDYNKLGKVISENIPKVGLNIDGSGITTYIISRNSFDTYLNNRRSFK